MADRMVYLYLAVPQCAFDFAFIIECLARHRVLIEYPGAVVVMSLSERGEQVEQSREWLLAAIRSEPTVRFQWWRNEAEDVYCRLRFVAQRCTIEFGLDGMDPSDESAFLDAISDLAKHYVACGILVACIIDHEGLSVAVFDDLFLTPGK